MAAVALIVGPPAASRDDDDDDDESVEVLFIVRADNPDDPWSGHVALPGGRTQPSDGPDPTATAVRETREEIGVDLLDPDTFTFAGTLDNVHVLHSRPTHTAILGIATSVFVSAVRLQDLVFELEPTEVAAVLAVPLATLGSSPAAASHVALPLPAIFSFVADSLPQSLWDAAGLSAPLFGRINLPACGALVLAVAHSDNNVRWAMEDVAPPMLWGLTLRIITNLITALDLPSVYPLPSVSAHAVFPTNPTAELLLGYLMYLAPADPSLSPDLLLRLRNPICLLITMAHVFQSKL